MERTQEVKTLLDETTKIKDAKNEEDKMDEKIIDLLAEGNNLELAEELKAHIDAAKVKLFKQKIGVKLKETLKEYGTLEIMNTIGDGDSGFAIKNENWPDYISIWFVFEDNNWSNLYSGIYFCDTSKETKSIRDHICKIAKKDEGWCSEENLSCDEYPLWNYMIDKYLNLDTATLLDIAKDPTDFCTEVKKRTEHYSKIIADALSQK